jgi:hypothetical protein
MKTLILLSIFVMALAFLPGCQTADQTTQSGGKSDAMFVGHKCSQCDCKAYSPSQLIKGVCKDCGHTAEEHSGTTK